MTPPLAGPAQDVLSEFEHLPHSLEPPTYYLCRRPPVSQADVMSYEHPNPTEKTVRGRSRPRWADDSP